MTGLETNRLEESDRQQTVVELTACAEGFDGADAALDRVAGDSLDQHPAQALTGELRPYLRTRQQDRVVTDR